MKGGIDTSELAYSEEMGDYFEELDKKTEACYDIGEKARAKGYDPETDVEIPRADDLAKRAQELTSVENTAEKIRELSEEYDREEVSIRIAKEVASREGGSKAERLEDAVRIGLAVLTEGILVAPLEGIEGVNIRDNHDGTDYVELSFAGPIRSAGGTGQAMSVLIADVVRRELDIGEFEATKAEIQRFKEEIPMYKKSLGLQYTPPSDEISLIVDGCPISISGEGTDKEVSGNRDLPRVETNRVRGGACLVIAEGMCLKAKKLKKYVDKLDIEGWEFIDEYIDRHASDKSDSSSDDEEQEGISPSFKYIKETIAGRPVFGHPSKKGGFRLRYGRARTGGLASIAVNPATMYLSEEFMALGTQLKTERPGKAGAVTPVDSIEGPTVLLKDGTVRQVNDTEEAIGLQRRLDEIIDLGEILIPYGEFRENNHPLVPAAYCHEWWSKEVESELEEDEIDAEKAVELSKDEDYPLHPKYVYFWDYVEKEDIEALRDWVSEEAEKDDDRMLLKEDEDMKAVLESVGIPHEVNEDKIIIHEHRPFVFTLGLDEETFEKRRESDADPVLDYLTDLAGVPIRSKAPTTIGSRMARPEKAKERKMSPPVHGLFPVGEAGGSERLISKAVDEDIIDVTISARRCKECGKSNAVIRCSCGGRAEIIDDPKEQKIPMKTLYRQALSTLGEGGNVEKVKGVKGLITETKTPEALEKGILRAKHDVWVFKDGTSRYDMTDLPLTHFKPKEIGISVKKAKELGYEKDIHGDELIDEEQVLELKAQDIIASKKAGDYLVKVSQFVDDLLEKYYDMDSYYEAERRKDLVGEIVVGLAPHTSGGVVGRLIGYHDGRAGYAHPYFHAAKRRNCDGDEDCVMLLLDGLLNFSEHFLPEKRGGLMDAPLVLTTRIDPAEIDSEAHNVDTVWEYPLEFYEKSFDYPGPKEVADLIETVEDRLGQENQYEDFGYTHETSDISEGPTKSRYTRLGKMTKKMEAQIKVADTIRAVDTSDVVSRVISDHFIPDLIGNLNKFGVQTIRCTKCNTKYRRMPLSGECDCGGNLTLTIHEGSVKKYLNYSLEMVENFEVPEYLYQRVKQLEDQIESLFENDNVSTPSLDEFC